MRRIAFSLAGLALALAIRTAAAAQPAELPPEAPVPAPAPNPAIQRDPTVPQGELRLLLQPQAENRPGVVAPAYVAPPPLPAISVRAKVIGQKGQASALITLGSPANAGNNAGYERFYQVVEGQTYHLLSGEDRMLNVVSIKREGITLELLPEKRQMILP
ncbi:hypothetical protein [Anatilimnocola floriformis]|uniref:hypothetical protein n=1 Tax=Anatilimnocola floriformis TaxID=2948575 RepID=UPI0020C2B437|nr:hypothetical protein [Anatilimnocola floriformis]